MFEKSAVWFSRTTLLLGVAFVLLPPLRAQTRQYGLPEGAQVLEIQSLSLHPHRTLILWILDAKRNPREAPSDPYTCPEETRGHCYSGRVRVSLFDDLEKNIINTVKIEDEHLKDPTFDIPYKIHNGYYFVAGVKGEREGKPQIMKLKDYNGDGRAEEFALFDAVACMGLSTTLIGYSIKQDKVIQYETLLHAKENGKATTETVKWIDYLFSKKPLRPGFWKYAIDYRGRGGSLDKYEIRYNAGKERFEGTRFSEAAK